MPEGQHPQQTAAAADGGMVRACDRCGTICSADQEWCLACGVRMSEVSTRLPGLRAAGVVVSLAVLLAGGAAAASYAALRSDTSTTAAAPAGPAGTPVTPAQTPPPVTPAEDPAATLPPVDEELPPVEAPDDLGDDLDDQASDLDLGPDVSGDVPPAPSAPPSGPDSSGDVPPAPTGGGGGEATDATDGGSTDSGSGTDTSTDTDEDTDAKPETESGPIELASGQGSLYDPDGVVADRGDEGRAIDGNVKTSWRATLAEGKTGEYGFVVDFDAATALKTLTLFSPTAGLKVKVLGTTRATLPETTTDAKWVELAPLKTLKGGAGASTDFKLDGAKKLRHVLVLVTEAPGTPAASQINEIKLSR